jgi:parallel beta-helix repeat protein
MRKKLIGILFCILMIISTIIPVSGTIFTKSSQSLTKGNILYVGGSGPNNYTKIQDAINDASKGDTIFVYTGTYNENLIVEKSLNICGENRDTTIIDGGKHGNVIYISANRVTITGFTITKGGLGHYAGVWLQNANFNKIIGNAILENRYWGICLNHSSYNRISGNSISNNDLGVEAGGDPQKPSNGNIFRDNVISSNDYIGIGFGWSKRNLFYQNILSNSTNGIYFWHNNFNIIYRNVITGNEQGILLQFSEQNLILCNNFLDNQQDVDFLIDKLIQNNRYLRNYWNESLSHPNFIHGGFLALNRSFNNPFRWIQIDWFPVQEPYDIP